MLATIKKPNLISRIVLFLREFFKRHVAVLLYYERYIFSRIFSAMDLTKFKKSDSSLKHTRSKK